MSDKVTASVTNLESAQAALRLHFLGWQCRLRQRAVRQADGRPSDGMCPAVLIDNDDNDRHEDSADRSAAHVTTLIVKANSAELDEITDQLRHLYRKTFDPAARRDAALKFFAAAYYQRAGEFSDQLTALFGPDSALAAQLIETGRCRLVFEQYSQRYLLPCRVTRLGDDDAAFQATYWHNSLFNPNLPGGVQVLGFNPNWAQARADPPPSSGA